MSAGSRLTASSQSDHELTASDLAVVIPTWARSEKLDITLRGLQEQTEQGFEIVVVVDGLDQELPDLPEARVLRQQHAGPGAARNRGVSATDRRLILFINDDMVPTRDLVACHLRRHRDHPADEVAVLGRVMWHPLVPNDRLHRWLDWSGALFDFASMRSIPGDDPGWGRFYSCNVSMKRGFFLASGGFDPEFVFDYEDLDLAWRLAQHGLRLVYEPRAVVQHLHHYDWAAVQRRYVSRAGAERLMMSKHAWFRPWFHDQMAVAQSEPRASGLWALAVDWVPRRAHGLRSKVARRADRHYRQRLAPVFLAAWEVSAPRDRGASNS